MLSSDAERRRHAPGAFAIVKGDPPQMLLALQVVAGADPAQFSPAELEDLRAALLEERWADAVLIWMETTGTFIDVYEEYVPVWTEAELDEEFASMEIRVSRIFDGA
jgi:hypothetical protein